MSPSRPPEYFQTFQSIRSEDGLHTAGQCMGGVEIAEVVLFVDIYHKLLAISFHSGKNKEYRIGLSDVWNDLFLLELVVQYLDFGAFLIFELLTEEGIPNSNSRSLREPVVAETGDCDSYS